MFAEDNPQRKRAAKWGIAVVAICCLICLCMRHISSVTAAIACLFGMLLGVPAASSAYALPGSNHAPGNVEKQLLKRLFAFRNIPLKLN